MKSPGCFALLIYYSFPPLFHHLCLRHFWKNRQLDKTFSKKYINPTRTRLLSIQSSSSHGRGLVRARGRACTLLARVSGHFRHNLPSHFHLAFCNLLPLAKGNANFLKKGSAPPNCFEKKEKENTSLQIFPNRRSLLQGPWRFSLARSVPPLKKMVGARVFAWSKLLFVM